MPITMGRYEDDWLNAMYVTPHDWTPFGEESLRREVVEPDQGKWDYRHQVLGQRHLRSWQLFAWVKGEELWFHLRPRRLWAILRTTDRFRRRQFLWVLRHIGLVWLGEVLEFVGAAFSRRRPRRRSKAAPDDQASRPATAFPASAPPIRESVSASGRSRAS